MQTDCYGATITKRDDIDHAFLRQVHALERVFYSHLGAVIVNLRTYEFDPTLSVDRQLDLLPISARQEVLTRFGTGNVILDAIREQYGPPTQAERRKYWRTDRKPTSAIV
ncbi:MAG: hypothetical protein F4227_00265 [Gammaproteobacteria bacterium]|nr:hypothetical protein [Gammaproteobacteria bacterium]MYF01447.1 hypothetical protein [Gammaproteobacteria bacterium]MYI77120.1 hypothetical protein [Gammaproteobacteria bacterium]